MEPKWLEYAKKLQGIAQAGLTYSKNKYDIERFEQIRQISIDILHHYTDMEHDKIRDLFANETGYQTPKIDVRGAIFKEDKILLVREKIDGLWSMPGGWADADLSIRENLVKEAKEEAGADIIPKRVLAILDRKKHFTQPFPYGVYKILVECDFVDEQFEDNVETSESGFFALDQLPPLSTCRNTTEQIEMCFKLRAKDCHETIFD
ncbi:MAG: NUDIX hydrolase N-terminal domain-containing protein [Bacillota bacterium]